ncbi:PAS domain-containing sensor histidine kinase [Maridesulfovibrio zosterae]|uniref:PAS domain-containing sensor histidine kinase n=1 Tax=Maridesulfovibrio zosterae TaxID=82171 RepID=UPI000687F245|nr:PAS domain-containing protein [Maridesulfovibrio zosterae]
MISPIAILDFIALGAIICALVISAFLPAKQVAGQVFNSFLLLLIVLATYEFLILIEWLGISSRLDFLEDYTGALLPLCWLFALYVMAQSTITKELTESERRFSYAMEATSDGLWDWDISSGKVFFSPHWFTMLGYKAKEFPSAYETWRKLVHPEDLHRAEYVIQQHIGIDEPFKIEFRMKTKSGEWLWVLARGKVVEKSPEGEPQRVVGTHVDISLRKQREVHIKKLQQYLSNIVDSMPSVLIGVDSQLSVTLWNYQAMVETGISSEDAMGKPLKDVFPTMTKDSELIKLAIQSGQTQRDSHRIRLKNGCEHYEDLTVYPLKTTDLEGTVIRLDDITEKNQMEEMIIQSEKMLSLGGLAAGMAHEINSPLSGIASSAYNLKRRLLEDLHSNTQMADECDTLLEKIHCYMDKRGISKMIDSITEASTRTSKLVNNILSFSRKSARKMEPTCLVELLENTYELAQNAYHTSKLGLAEITVEREYSHTIPKLICDASMLQQVLFNIFRNGLEAMAEKEYVEDQPHFLFKIYSEKDFVVLEIEDNGPGMDDQVKDKIFNAFFTTKKDGAGTGLGLSISYFIITELHNGSMEVFSTPELFTRFVIKLPLNKDGM